MYVVITFSKPNKRAFPCGIRRREGGTGSDATEHVIVCAHCVIPHEQLASEGFVVEVLGEIAHCPFEVVALFDDVPCEVFFAVPFSAVGFLEVVEIVVQLLSRRSPLRLSFLSEVGFLSLCPRSSAVCVGAFAVRAFFSCGLPRGGTPCIVVSLSPRKGLTHYDTADFALAIIVSTDTPGAPALAFADYIFGRE